jgi:Carboxypeptidase regulatory-like domain
LSSDRSLSGSHPLNANDVLRYHKTSPQRAGFDVSRRAEVVFQEVDMHKRTSINLTFWGLTLAAGLLSLVAGSAVRANSPTLITVSVVVTDSQTGQPVNQAHLTLVFQTAKDPNNALKRSKTISYTAKTDAQGRCRFVYIPEGPVKLMVTEDRHQTFGQAFDVSKDHSTLEVKMKPPQPLL